MSTFALAVNAQERDTTKLPPNWHLNDPADDRLEGVSAEKAYLTLLKGQPSKTILVAVIDAGIDYEHEDLKSIMWTNPGEITGNGIDDDNNGYIDDVHGWNFLGGKTANVQYDTYELTREYIRLRSKFGTTEESKIPKKQKAAFDSYQKIKTKYEKLKAKNTDELSQYSKLYKSVSFCSDTVKQIMKLDSVTEQDLESFRPGDPMLVSVKTYLQNIFEKVGSITSLDDFLRKIKESVDYYSVIVNYGYNDAYDSRLIIGDNYSDLSQRQYGNNDVKGPDAEHGTHVAGLIAADRTNNIGIKGIADNVRIMSVRAVPNGDERDKDVANAIRYAADNGAKIINMSFGKKFSPEKEYVDKAVKYAMDKGVLIIHAAGNDSDDIDVEKNFPSRVYLNGKVAKNWIEVGASSAANNATLLGDFSNYGKKSVDLFAPGVDLYSTVVGNKYKSESGTSMASPVTAGVAALIMSYFPDLTAAEVRDVLMKSVRHFDNLKVELKRTKTEVNFSDLSVTGGVINAYDAVKLAMEMKANKKTR